jgi:nucleotide-binding universal stress UspA family protein
MHDSGRFRSLLVGVGADIAASNAAVIHAMELAVAYRAKLTVYVFAPDLLQPFPLTLGSSSIWIAQETERLAQASAHAEQTVSQLASENGIGVSIEHAHSPFEGRYQRFIALGRLHDLTILQADKRSHDWVRPAIEHAIFDTGRPVLITPGTDRRSMGKVAIAWDGSARAARAVRDSLDFLIVAEEVSIATVLDTKGSEGLKSADDLSTYLALYGIQAKIVVVPDQPGGDEGEPMRSFLVSERIELLVMGAFVHSRLRQSVLGGMTRALLDSCPVPLTMAY